MPRPRNRRARGLLPLAAVVVWVSACGPLTEPRRDQQTNLVVYVIERGWHTDIALSAQDLSGQLAAFRRSLPGARYFTFGFGDRDYVLSRSTTFLNLLRAMLPGRGAMLVTALRASPPEAFGTDVIALRLPEGGLDRMSRFLWDYFGKGRGGEPDRIGDGPYLGSVFYASVGTYDAVHNCNTWVMEALQAGGLPVNTTGTVLANQVMAQAKHVAILQFGDRSPASAD